MSNNILTTSKSPTFLLGAAAVGFVVGLAANFGRKAAVQGITAVQGNWDEGLKAEHKLTLRLFDAIGKTDDTQTWKRGMLLTQLKHALGKHAFEEENVVYPAMRDHGLAEEADQLVHDHGYVKQYLYDLSEIPNDDPRWLVKVHEFRGEIEAHVEQEEEQLFPRLRAALGEEGNAHVSAEMNKAGFAAA